MLWVNFGEVLSHLNNFDEKRERKRERKWKKGKKRKKIYTYKRELKERRNVDVKVEVPKVDEGDRRRDANFLLSFYSQGEGKHDFLTPGFFFPIFTDSWPPIDDHGRMDFG